jgi:flagellar biosynthetic protein FlhB
MDRTEAPTPKRREDARKRGQIARSAEVTGILAMSAGFLAVGSRLPDVVRELQQTLRYFWETAFLPSREAYFRDLAPAAVACLVQTLGPVLLIITGAALAAGAMQTGLRLTPELLKPDLSRVNPLTGIRQLFSPQSAAELVKGLLKVALVGYVGVAVVKGAIPLILNATGLELGETVFLTLTLAKQLGQKMLLTLGVLAVADYGWQKYQHERNLKMTKEEIKEETKMSEGNPQTRSRLRRRALEIVFSRMRQAVPQAHVVITNPTHIAIALRYDPQTMAAPRVLARGLKFLAERIKALARQHNVPVVENPPLAQALYKSARVGDEIPPNLYRAVAEVLAYVYRLTGRSLTEPNPPQASGF